MHVIVKEHFSFNHSKKTKIGSQNKSPLSLLKIYLSSDS